jgi:predicted aconitase
LDSAPGLGDQIAWGESNAVVFANSVLGARTQKYADYLDICAAITGRVPLAGPHLDDQRVATVVLDATTLAGEGGLGDSCADAFFPALGYLCGLQSEARVPVVVGLEDRGATMDELKAFSGVHIVPVSYAGRACISALDCIGPATASDNLLISPRAPVFAAAFGSTASVALFHIAGITPEAPDVETALAHKPPLETLELTADGLADAWRSLDSCGQLEQSNQIELVAVGNPHLSLTVRWLASYSYYRSLRVAHDTLICVL